MSNGNGQGHGQGSAPNEFGSNITVASNAHGVPIDMRTNGHAAPLFPDGQEPEASSYLKYLPSIYSADPFVGRFLRIFEDVLSPVSVMVDNQPYYFDPMTSPVDLLKWLAFWVNVEDEGNDWTLPKKRSLVEAAATLYRLRGTRAEIKRHLSIYTGGMQLVMERTNGFRLGPDARIGLNTSMGENRPSTFTVTIAVPNPKELDIGAIRSIIEADKPVNTQYVLRIVKLEMKGNKKPPKRKAPATTTSQPGPSKNGASK